MSDPPVWWLHRREEACQRVLQEWRQGLLDPEFLAELGKRGRPRSIFRPEPWRWVPQPEPEPTKAD